MMENLLNTNKSTVQISKCHQLLHGHLFNILMLQSASKGSLMTSQSMEFLSTSLSLSFSTLMLLSAIKDSLMTSQSMEFLSASRSLPFNTPMLLSDSKDSLMTSVSGVLISISQSSLQHSDASVSQQGLPDDLTESGVPVSFCAVIPSVL